MNDLVKCYRCKREFYYIDNDSEIFEDILIVTYICTVCHEIEDDNVLENL